MSATHFFLWAYAACVIASFIATIHEYRTKAEITLWWTIGHVLLVLYPVINLWFAIASLWWTLAERGVKWNPVLYRRKPK
jgi:hypothetical protein